ncbi:MAG: hypothetical protein VXX85_00335 [Candidatus Margulisiibacteriota bacterium]|nr:hypothetical protein [Candidatus Margulisiibacteriota bacterium]
MSFIFLIINLNFNVRTFRLTQELQTLTISLQNLEQRLEEKEYFYYSRTSLDKVYDTATKELKMVRQSNPIVFTNSAIESRRRLIKHGIF